MMQNTLSSPQQEMVQRRLPIVIVFLVLLSVLMIVWLARYQWLPPEVAREFELRASANVSSVRRLPAERGLIFDRDGQPFAVNTIQYEIGVSPNLITDPRDVAERLALVLGMDEFEIYQKATSNRPWEQVARPVSAEVGQEIADLDILGVRIDPLTRRFYPQGELAGQVIGFVIEDVDGARGALGIEGYYNDQLAGQNLNQEVSNIPFDLPLDEITSQRGRNIILTIDRDLQFWVESELQRSIEETGSTQGTIIIMDPRNGDILAMASWPNFDPNNFQEVEDPALLRNAAVSESYEPGSVMKVLTVAGAIEHGTVTPTWTYNDQASVTVGGATIENWDRQAHGVVDATQVLVQSLNLGVTTMALQMGHENFYNYMRAFGFGQLTRVDLMAEEAGLIKVPGDPDWSESDLATNSFGQGVSVTPLQMITAVSAIANDGLMMQPRVVRQVIDGEQVIDAQPAALGRPVSAETAQLVSQMMVRVVQDGASQAALTGYSIAGKTGTAQIPATIGYEANSSIVTFVGFLPADDPQAVVLLKLNRPTGYWGTEVAAPAFRRLAERLVLLMDIPTDDIRYNLAAEGGLFNER